jgi:hypothetical protein
MIIRSVKVRLSRRGRAGALLGAVALAVPLLAAVPVTSAGAATGNQCSNPVLATSLTGWGPLDGAAVSRDPVGDLQGANWAFDTSGRSFYMPQVAVSAGQSWTFSARDRVVYGSGTAKIAVDWYGSGNTYLSSTSAAKVTLPQSSAAGGSTGSWTPVSGTFTVPSGATSAHVLQYGDFGSATGTDFKATMCDYQLNTSTPPPTTTPPSVSDSAATRYGWGTPNASQSDEYNGTSLDTTKWGPFGSDATHPTGCSTGYNGHGQRCTSQVTVKDGNLQVTGTPGGVTGGLFGKTRPFKYGRIEVRERAVPLPGSGAAYNAVPLLWPKDDADWNNAEVDFAERLVGAPKVQVFVHHGTQDSASVTIDSTTWHNYAIDWQPNSISWYVDGNLIKTFPIAINYFSRTNGGAQLDMFPVTGTLMQGAREDVDWIRMYPVAATQYF